MRVLLTALVLVAATAAVAAAAPSGAAGPNGTYVRTVTKADIARTARFRHEGPGETTPPVGVVHITFAARGFRFVDPTAFAISQTYSATATGRLTIKAYVNPGKGSFCGPEVPQNASYTWTSNGRILSLKATDDRCADRNSLLSGRWTRVGG